ncbi:hypothetical protein [Streptomyces mirabilis]|uniref:hypothetical protein n=1 Tax=Streptomyces mirabilis TaxID=68239 RepID=UPI0036C82366
MMSAAVITASASILVAVLAFVLGQRAQVLQERRQARLARVNSQLRELYGPLRTLVDVNEMVWESLRGSHLPPKEERRPEAGTDDWRRWRDTVLMPTNFRMRDLIVEHADLLIETETPEPLRDFCAHVASMEVLLSDETESSTRNPLIRHPGAAYVDYVRTAFTQLKNEQQQILRAVSP